MRLSKSESKAVQRARSLLEAAKLSYLNRFYAHRESKPTEHAEADLQAAQTVCEQFVNAERSLQTLVVPELLVGEVNKRPASQ
jgi:hypothetical protein